MVDGLRRAVVVGTSAVARAVVAALRADGATVTTAASGAEFAGLAVALRAGGADGPQPGADVVVHAPHTPGSAVPRALVDLTPDAWDRLAEEPVRDGLTALQAAYPLLAPARGRFVLVVPSVAIEGGAGVVASATASEALRALAKSAARRWAPDGVGVHLVAASVFASAPEAEALRGTDVDRSEAVLGADAMTPEAVAEVVLLVCGPGGRHLTGGTLVLDGGALMLP
ncbi:SDR family oxidoreductase [Yinghuangia sp. ASG 101]|uniref:SDR family oxidoreductase n=1 Tax=Yinghuangia sp. ASG 101 TaxID=2896848 RepID=UPI001E3430D5|nr:SDR family oxidoreductase [Yinghuangia sp. ASG 101]UGQ14317.1 SDR family oxidoreductase [Yinghuangia sp. ASG 101]